MVNGDNLRIDELILQVFEEHEDIFFWPVSSQKDAKSFVKYMHDKGAPYEDIGKEIGEFEHNFSAWRKGLGRVGIGSRMIDRINKTVEEVILSDEEDDVEQNLKILSKINKKKTAEGKKDPEPVASKKEMSPKPTTPSKESSPAPAMDPKQQNSDLASSMMRNIDKVKEVFTERSPTPEQKETKVQSTDSEQSSDSRESSEPRDSPDRGIGGGKSAFAAKRDSFQEKIDDTKLERKKSPSPAEVKQETKVNKEEEVTGSTKEEVKDTKTETTSKSEATKVEETAKVNKPKPQEDDDVKQKMEALKKKVEMMKKAKAEAAAARQQENGGDDHLDNKLDSVKQKIQDIRNRAEERVTGMEEKSPERDDDETHKNPPLVNLEDDGDLSGSSEESSEDEDDETDQLETPTYFSDIDPDNYDSDLDFEMNQRASKLSAEIHEMRTKSTSRDGPGHVYIFSDSPSSAKDSHRLMVGVSRSPDKRYEEARKYNPSLKQVSMTAVNKRHKSLCAIRKALKGLSLEGSTDWYQGAVDVILQRISAATEKFGSGPALVSFSSKC